MSMTVAYFNGTALPLDFEYYPEYKTRIAVTQTLTADVVQKRDFYEGDTYYIFKNDYVTKAIRDVFIGALKAQTTVTFKDYDGNSISVLLVEFSEKEVAGYYNISGKMKKMVT